MFRSRLYALLWKASPLPLLLLLLATTTAFATPSSTPPIDIHCKGDPLLSEQVITQQANDWTACGSFTNFPNNVQGVQVLASNTPTPVCVSTPLQTGVVVLREFTYEDTCNSAALVLEQLTPQSSSPLTVCNVTTPPSGWLTYAEYQNDTTQRCPVTTERNGTPTVTSVLITPPAGPTIVCADSFVPSDYQVDNRSESTSQCPNDNGHSLLIEPGPGNKTTPAGIAPMLSQNL